MDQAYSLGSIPASKKYDVSTLLANSNVGKTLMSRPKVLRSASHSGRELILVSLPQAKTDALDFTVCKPHMIFFSVLSFFSL